MIYFETERLICRAFEFSDLAAFTAYRADPEVARYQGWQDYHYRDALALFDELQNTAFDTPGTWMQLALECRQTRVLVGDLALHFIDEQQVEIGFTLASEYQGQGLAREALQALLIYLFDGLGKHRISAITDVKNHAAWGLLERLGFRREAHYRDNIFFKGSWGSEYGYALLASEWRQVKTGESIQDFRLIRRVAPLADFLRLRQITGLTPRSRAAAKAGLPLSLFGVHILADDRLAGESVIAMGRVVGDGALNFELVDIAVDPDYQGRGLGSAIMSAIMEYLDEAAPKGAYITLMADVPELYLKFGFKLSRPASEGMYLLQP